MGRLIFDYNLDSFFKWLGLLLDGLVHIHRRRLLLLL